MVKYPWLVALWLRDPSLAPAEYTGPRGCGGTIIASRFVISAAHCLYLADQNKIVYKELFKNDLAVRVGEHILNEYGETGLEIFVNINHIYKNPNYQQNLHQPRWKNGYDMVMFELEYDLPLDTYTPACLPRHSEGNRFDGKTITLAGWGYTTAAMDVINNEPYEVNLTVSTIDACLLSNQNPSIMCAGQPEIGKGACKVKIEILTKFLRYYPPSSSG